MESDALRGSRWHEENFCNALTTEVLWCSILLLYRFILLRYIFNGKVKYTRKMFQQSQQCSKITNRWTNEVFIINNNSLSLFWNDNYEDCLLLRYYLKLFREPASGALCDKKNCLTVNSLCNFSYLTFHKRNYFWNNIRYK